MELNDVGSGLSSKTYFLLPAAIDLLVLISHVFVLHIVLYAFCICGVTLVEFFSQYEFLKLS